MQLGAYTIEAPLGHGGMGTVWLARRTDGRFEGKAAVKILNLALLSPAGQERFRREGSTLARLTHPGIGRLLDAGVSPSGQPYLVLELVEGTPIDEYVTSKRLGPAACVELFLRVLDAVAHAHANLVVHRDIKPSNILVTSDGTPKLLDFGIAKLLSGGPESSVQTVGGQAFTPRFAAPEQLQGGTITTGTDIYSLGVLLALLLGREPEKAETKLGLGDLDTVIARATRAEPAERYQTVAEFAEDLRRWMRHEPVSARPDSLWYRARKFLRRHATATGVTLLFSALVATYVVTVTRDRARIRQALAEATMATRKAEQVTDFALGLFETKDGSAPFPMNDAARDLLARGLEQARALQGEPTLKAQMLDVIGRIYAQQGDRSTAQAIFTEALEIRSRALGDDHPEVATSLINIGNLISQVEPKQKAIPYLRRALEIRRRHFGDHDERTQDALYSLAGALHMSGDFAAARPLYAEWIAGALEGHAGPSVERADRLAAMASIAAFSGQTDDAERLARQAVEVEYQLFGRDNPRVAFALTRLGTISLITGDPIDIDSLFTRPVAILRKAYPDGDAELANTLRDYGLALGRLGRWREAEEIWKEAAAMLQKVGRGRTLAYANALTHGSLATLRLGRPQDALRALREAIRLHGEISPRSTPILQRAHLFLAMTLLEIGETGEARELLENLSDSLLSPGDRSGYYIRMAQEARARLAEW
jgi:serine/threonine-protein kinase